MSNHLKEIQKKVINFGLYANIVLLFLSFVIKIQIISISFNVLMFIILLISFHYENSFEALLETNKALKSLNKSYNNNK